MKTAEAWLKTSGIAGFGPSIEAWIQAIQADARADLEAAGNALAEALGDVNPATYRHELEAWAKALSPEAGRRG
jgi:hypothetical protein